MKKIYIIVFICLAIATCGMAQMDIVKGSDKKKIDCKQCHLCENPTAVNPCLKMCPRFDALSSPHTTKLKPDVIIIDIISDLYVPVVFSHQLHAEMSDMSGGCQICHHHNPPGAILACRDCHEVSVKRADLNRPGLKGAYHRQCLGCHREWSHTTKCSICHALKSALKTTEASADSTDIVGTTHPPFSQPEKIVYETSSDEGKLITFYHNEHVNLFGFACVNCHQKENCSKCHDLAKPTLAEQLLPGKPVKIHKSEAEHHMKCSACHENAKCNFCHDNKEKMPFNHLVSSGWKLKSYHQGLSCIRCHINMEISKKISHQCSACHKGWYSGNFNHTVTGLKLDENHKDNDCGDCHINSNYSTTPECQECHDQDIAFPKELPGKRVQ